MPPLHHHSAFPATVALLTAALAALVAWTYAGKPLVSPHRVVRDQGTVNSLLKPEDYDRSVHDRLVDLPEVLRQNADTESRERFLEETLNWLLSVPVPAERREVHLAFALSLNGMREGLTADGSTKFEESWQAFEATLLRLGWVRE
ncbi:MAG TPA: hypothetical protein VJB99_01105 [Patescibacteria group bacterium]|nr:hypothetical protein [Patescibacteria group bacterium]